MIQNILQHIHKSFHPSTTDNLIPWEVLYHFTNFLHHVQQIGLIGFKSSNQELWVAQYIIDYSFAVPLLTLNQVLILIVFCFLINIGLVILLLLSALTHYRVLLQLQISLVIYHKIAIIPTLYASGLILFENICTTSVCNPIGFYYFIASLNLVFVILQVIAFLFFARSDAIEDDNIVLRDHFYIFKELIKKLVLVVAIILSILNFHQLFMICCLSVRWILSFVSGSIKTKNIMDTTSAVLCLIITINIYFNAAFPTVFITLTLILNVHIILHNRIINQTVLSNNQENLEFLQILFMCNQYRSDQQYIMLSGIIQLNHICKKCKHLDDIMICIIKRMILKKVLPEQIELIYCYQINQKSQYKCLIYLINLQNSQIYYQRFACKTLSDIVRTKINEASHQYDELHNKKTGDEEVSLDVKTFKFTFYSSQLIFTQLRLSIKQITKFWKELIQGLPSISDYLNQMIRVAEEVLKIKSIMNKTYDLTQMKLKNCPTQDVISLRIIQIYYATIYSSQSYVIKIQRSIDELLKADRFKSEAKLTNLQLENNNALVLSTSLAFNRGQIYRIDVEKLARFLNIIPEKLLTIRNITQLMPSFISDLHEYFIENFLRRGVTQHSHTPLRSYIQLQNGFLLQVQIYVQICNLIYEPDDDGQLEIKLNKQRDESMIDKEDLLINAIITKISNNTKQIVFGVDGKILGMDEETFTLMKANYQEDPQKPILIHDIVHKGGLIQYYLSNITERVSDLRSQIEFNQAYKLHDLEGDFRFPQSHANLIFQTQYILNNFEPQNKTFYSMNSVKTFKDIVADHSKKKKILNYNNANYYEFRAQELLINDNLILMLHQDFQDQVQVLIDTNDEYIERMNHLNYNLEYNQYKYNNETYGYFIITINDITQTKLTKQPSSFTKRASQMPMFFPNMTIQDKDPDADVKSDLHSDREASNILRQKYLFLEQIQNSARQYNISTVQGNLLSDPIQQESKGAESSESSYKQSVPEDKMNDAQSPHRMTKILNKKQNIMTMKSGGKQQNQVQAQYQASVQQSVTASEFSKDNIIILDQLNIRQLPIQLKLAIIFAFIQIILIATSLGLNEELINSSLNSQLNEIDLLLGPKDSSYIYLTMYGTTLLFQLNATKISNYSIGTQGAMWRSWYDPLYVYKARGNLLQTQTVQTAEILGDSLYIANFVIKGQITQQQMQLNDILTLIVQNLMSNFNDFSFSKVVTAKSFARQNIIQINSELRTVFNYLAIQLDNINQSIKNNFMIYMIVEIVIIVLMIFIEFFILSQFDEISKQILFLVTRITENQIQEYIFQLDKQLILISDENSMTWKQNDFGSEIFQPFAKDGEIVDDKNIKQKQIKMNKSSLYSRIPSEQFINYPNLIFLCLLTLIWLIYNVTGYIIFVQKLNVVQPSMKITYNAIKLQKDIRAVSLLALIIKTDPLFQNNLSLIDQNATISEFDTLLQGLPLQINNLTDLIYQLVSIESSYSNFQTILDQNLCQFYSDYLQNCGNNTNYTLFDNYQTVVSQGLVNYVQAQYKYLQQEFIYELNHFKYLNNSLSVINTQSWHNYVTQFFLDIDIIVYALQQIVMSTNQTIIANFLSFINSYYIGAGIRQLQIIFSILIIYLSIQIFWIYKTEKRITCIRQCLGLIPSQITQMPNIRNQIYKIHKLLF